MTIGPLVVMATGVRTWQERRPIEHYISRLAQHSRPVLVLHGGLFGADSMIETACDRHNLEYEAHAPKWGDHGKAAQDIRWQEMIDRATCALIFHDRVGLEIRHLISRIKRNQLPTWVVYSTPTALILGTQREKLCFGS